jgi:hypothetical protein
LLHVAQCREAVFQMVFVGFAVVWLTATESIRVEVGQGVLMSWKLYIT